MPARSHSIDAARAGVGAACAAWLRGDVALAAAVVAHSRAVAAERRDVRLQRIWSLTGAVAQIARVTPLDDDCREVDRDVARLAEVAMDALALGPRRPATDEVDGLRRQASVCAERVQRALGRGRPATRARSAGAAAVARSLCAVADEGIARAQGASAP
ncbi:MAG: hypothetical protein AB7V42_11390 [Thermoleophilia bacterium]